MNAGGIEEPDEGGLAVGGFGQRAVTRFQKGHGLVRGVAHSQAGAEILDEDGRLGMAEAPALVAGGAQDQERAGPGGPRGPLDFEERIS